MGGVGLLGVRGINYLFLTISFQYLDTLRQGCIISGIGKTSNVAIKAVLLAFWVS